MRPLKLRVRGFTSFRDEQTLDFTNLSVFAITGPTGSGKSSLLDALTYALYGQVERVGRECNQLVTHGVNRMSVTLDFDVDGKQYRITRSTPASGGSTKVTLEKSVAGEFVSYGEGADRVRECDRIIQGLVGLDYTGFTRSVLLPQGKFAEFMSGEARERRDILSDLLGLGLFKRMAQRAGRLASDAENAASVKQEVVRNSFADATPENVEQARQVAEQVAERVARHQRVASEVGAIAERWRDDQVRLGELRPCAVDLRNLVAEIESAARAVGDLTTAIAEHRAALDAARTAAQAAAEQACAARTEREGAESAWGSQLELAAAQGSASRLPELRSRLALRQRELEQALAEAPVRVAELGGLETAHSVAVDHEQTSEIELAEAQAHTRELEHADKAASLTTGLSVGDACPICGKPLDSLPEHPGAPAIAKARARVKACERALRQARAGAVELQQQVVGKRHDIENTEKDVERRRDDLAQHERELERAESEVRTALRGLVADNPSAVLATRIQQLADLAARERDAEKRESVANQEQASVRAEGELLEQRLGHQRQRIEAPNAVLLDRASGLVPEFVVESPSALEDTASAAELLAFGRRRAGLLTGLVGALDASVQALESAGKKALVQALTLADDLVTPAPSIGALVDALTTARLAATAEHVAAEARATNLAARLEERTQLEREIAEQRDQAGVFDELAYDLRQDRLVAFLQDRALQTLAAAGTRHLQGLSADRYALRFARQTFWVVDRWNGDEERTVRTLSGGETFLASLSLALALSEQVRSLSITERARLDSLFLDEGFGTLDPDSLRVVQDAIEQLGGDGRLVGVITHVRDLAEALPRIEVEKSTRGSRVLPLSE
jgi:exonuclease SbcC